MALVPPTTNKLATQTVSSSFDQLLYIDNDAGLAEATLRTVATETTKSALQLCGEKVLVKSVETDQASAFAVQNAAGTNVLKCGGDTLDVTLGDDLLLNTDGCVLKLGAGADFTITHDGDTGATLAGNPITITAGEASTWSTSSGALTLTSAAAATWSTSAGALSLSGATEIDLTSVIIDVNATTTCTIDNTNTSNGVVINAATSGGPISIGHATSETTVNDNLTVTGTSALNDHATIAVNKQLKFGDANQHIATDNDDLTITSDVSINLSAPQVDLLVDTNFVTTGGVNGMSIDGTTFSVDGANNRVGIGTAAPGKILHIQDASPYMYLEADDAVVADAAHLFNLFFMSTASDATNSNRIGARMTVVADGAWSSDNSNYAPSKIIFATNDASSASTLDLGSDEAMVIDKDSKVGIGTASPATELDVDGDITMHDDKWIGANADSGDVRIIFDQDNGQLEIMGQSATTVEVGINTQSTDGLLTIKAGADDDNMLRLQNSDGDSIFHAYSADKDGILVMSQDDDGAKIQLNTNGVSYFNGGYVGINGSPSYRLDVQEDRASSWVARFTNVNATDAGCLLVELSGDSWTDDHGGEFIRCTDSDSNNIQLFRDGDISCNEVTESDRRIKENIIDATSKLADINKLKVRNFNFLTSQKKKKKMIGFIADELEEVFPNLIKERKSLKNGVEYDDLKHISQSVLIPILVKAIQELSAEVEKLKGDA